MRPQRPGEACYLFSFLLINASTLSHCLSHSLFFPPNQVRFYQAFPVGNHYLLWNFRRQSVWEPQYQLRSSRPAPLQTRRRFLKRREKLHKEHIWDRFNTDFQWKHFHTLFNLISRLLFHVLVYFKHQHWQLAAVHCKFENYFIIIFIYFLYESAGHICRRDASFDTMTAWKSLSVRTFIVVYL